ncbi:hypothetical protein KM043_006626 [Ampulex compressa]|nr:hypothetical protein KM043_006626 [Ampulex compressa]
MKGTRDMQASLPDKRVASQLRHDLEILESHSKRVTKVSRRCNYPRLAIPLRIAPMSNNGYGGPIVLLAHCNDLTSVAKAYHLLGDPFRGFGLLVFSQSPSIVLYVASS